MPMLPLRDLAGDGGLCACVRVVVVRRYPTQYMETTPDGKLAAAYEVQNSFYLLMNIRNEHLSSNEHSKYEQSLCEHWDDLRL